LEKGGNFLIARKRIIYAKGEVGRESPVSKEEVLQYEMRAASNKLKKRDDTSELNFSLIWKERG